MTVIIRVRTFTLSHERHHSAVPIHQLVRIEVQGKTQSRVPDSELKSSCQETVFSAHDLHLATTIATSRPLHVVGDDMLKRPT